MNRYFTKMLFSPRTQLVLTSAVVAGFARALGLVFTVVVTPMVYRALGPEEFGLWTIIVQLITLAAFADFGLGNGLLTRLNQTEHQNEKAAYISSAFFLLLFISVCIFFLGQIALTLFSEHFFHCNEFKYCDSATLTLRAFLIIFCGILPFSIIQKAQFSNLKNFIFHAWEIADKGLATLAVIIILPITKSLPFTFIAFYLPTLISNSLNFFTYNNFSFWKTALNRSFVEKTKMKDLLIIGKDFFFLTIIFNLSRGTDGILLGYIGNLEAVSNYQLPLRLFDLILVVTMLFTSPLWSGYANAIKSHDIQWIKSALFRSILTSTLFACLIGGLLAIYGDETVSAWTGTKITLSKSIYYGLFAFTLLNTSINVLSAYLNARALVKAQLIMFAAFGLIGIPAKIIGYRVDGLSGFIMANCASLFICVFIPSIAVIYKDYFQFKTNLPISLKTPSLLNSKS